MKKAMGLLKLKAETTYSFISQLFKVTVTNHLKKVKQFLSKSLKVTADHKLLML